MNLSLGDRIKAYEAQETHARFLPNVPIIARVDGRCFSKFTESLQRPFSRPFSDLMQEVTQKLIQDTGASIGYTQSDEINLCWHQPEVGSEIFFGGKKFKMISQLAALATAHFLMEGESRWAGRIRELRPTFDARVFQVPTLMEGANAFLWRQLDARRNAVSMVARHFFSHNDLMNKSTREKLDMLAEREIDFVGGYHPDNRNGVFIRRELVSVMLSGDELAKIPEEMRPTGLVQRHRFVHYNSFPLLSEMVNPDEVIFYGAQPILKTEQ